MACLGCYLNRLSIFSADFDCSMKENCFEVLDFFVFVKMEMDYGPWIRWQPDFY